MSEFLGSSQFLLPLLGFVKAFAVAMFALNVGVIFTWVDRRMRGMIQDSIGPNRAAIPLPGKIVAGLAAGPAFLVAAAVAGGLFSMSDSPESYSSWGALFTHAGLFVLWISTAGIARVVAAHGPKNPVEAFIGDLGGPRSIVRLGFLAHFVIFFIGVALQGTTFEDDFARSLFFGGGALLIFAVLASALHVAANLAKEKVIRLILAGLLHPAADGLKTAFKSDFAPVKGDKLLYNLAPLIAFFPAVVVIAIVPFGPALCFGRGADGLIDFGKFQGIEAAGATCDAARFSLQVADLNVGLLFFFAMAGTGIVGAALAGWASDNKFSLLGGMRAASQMVSYEVTLGLTVIGAIMVYGTIRVDEMVLWQAENAWGIFVQPLAFFLFIAAAIAETKRIPFDIPEGESEIVAGYFTEYAGMKFSMFFISEYIAVVTSSTLMAALFFGGWHMPFFTADGIRVVLGETVLYSATMPPEVLVILGALGFIGKILILCWVQVVIRWTLPRFRYDQLMRLGWRKLLPASLVNLMLTAIVLLALESGSAHLQAAAAFAGQLSMAFLALLGAAAPVALVLFLFAPATKQRLVVNSAARYAAALGGTREAKMEA